MPRALRRSESVLAQRTSLCIAVLLSLACREQAPSSRQASEHGQDQPSAEPARVRRLAPTGGFDCRELRPVPKTEAELIPETIELVAPGAGKTVFFSKTGERVTFDRDEFLKAARCLKLEQAVRFLEEETGKEQESPI